MQRRGSVHGRASIVAAGGKESPIASTIAAAANSPRSIPTTSISEELYIISQTLQRLARRSDLPTTQQASNPFETAGESSAASMGQGNEKRAVATSSPRDSGDSSTLGNVLFASNSREDLSSHRANKQHLPPTSANPSLPHQTGSRGGGGLSTSASLSEALVPASQRIKDLSVQLSRVAERSRELEAELGNLRQFVRQIQGSSPTSGLGGAGGLNAANFALSTGIGSIPSALIPTPPPVNSPTAVTQAQAASVAFGRAGGLSMVPPALLGSNGNATGAAAGGGAGGRSRIASSTSYASPTFSNTQKSPRANALPGQQQPEGSGGGGFAVTLPTSIKVTEIPRAQPPQSLVAEMNTRRATASMASTSASPASNSISVNVNHLGVDVNSNGAHNPSFRELQKLMTSALYNVLESVVTLCQADSGRVMTRQYASALSPPSTPAAGKPLSVLSSPPSSPTVAAIGGGGGRGAMNSPRAALVQPLSSMPEMVSICNVGERLRFPPSLVRKQCEGSAEASVLSTGIALHQRTLGGGGGGGGATSKPLTGFKALMGELQDMGSSPSPTSSPRKAPTANGPSKSGGSKKDSNMLVFPIRKPNSDGTLSHPDHMPQPMHGGGVRSSSSSAQNSAGGSDVIAVLVVENKNGGTVPFTLVDENLCNMASKILGEIMSRMPLFAMDWTQNFFDPIPLHVVVPFAPYSHSPMSRAAAKAWAQGAGNGAAGETFFLTGVRSPANSGGGEKGQPAGNAVADSLTRLKDYVPEQLIHRTVIQPAGSVETAAVGSTSTATVFGGDNTTASALSTTSSTVGLGQAPTLREVDVYLGNLHSCWQESVRTVMSQQEAEHQRHAEMKAVRGELIKARRRIEELEEALRLQQSDSGTYAAQYNVLQQELQAYLKQKNHRSTDEE